MTNYLLKRDDKSSTIIWASINNPDDGYIFKPKRNLAIDKIVVINPSLINKILSVKFYHTFELLAKTAISVITDEGSDADDARKILGEIARLKAIVLNKYHRFLVKEREKKFLHKLMFLENEVNNYLLSYTNNEILENEKQRSR